MENTMNSVRRRQHGQSRVFSSYIHAKESRRSMIRVFQFVSFFNSQKTKDKEGGEKPMAKWQPYTYEEVKTILDAIEQRKGLVEVQESARKVRGLSRTGTALQHLYDVYVIYRKNAQSGYVSAKLRAIFSHYVDQLQKASDQPDASTAPAQPQAQQSKPVEEGSGELAAARNRLSEVYKNTQAGLEQLPSLIAEYVNAKVNDGTNEMFQELNELRAYKAKTQEMLKALQ